MEALKAEQNMRLDGGPGRDLSRAMDWAENAHPDNLRLIKMYSTYLRGQHAGMTDALDLSAVVASMNILGVEQADRPELARRLIILHGLVRREERLKENRG